MDSIRRQIEAEEEMILAPWACHAAQSLGREYEEEPDPLRTCFMRDRDRIIHTKAFRRLKHKTQVYIAPENDHYRTRLTHTLEVNQIARSIGRGLKLNCDLIEAIALGHDVGHTPFAHTGERVLDRLMPGGFAHNENSLRVLSKLETRSDGVSPLNLSKEVLDGVLHHSGLRGEGSNMPMTLEGQVVRLCDKIAYVQHDIDDSVRTGLFSLEEIPRAWMQILGRNHGQRHRHHRSKGFKVQRPFVLNGFQAAQKSLPIRGGRILRIRLCEGKHVLIHMPIIIVDMQCFQPFAQQFQIRFNTVAHNIGMTNIVAESKNFFPCFRVHCGSTDILGRKTFIALCTRTCRN